MKKLIGFILILTLTFFSGNYSFANEKNSLNIQDKILKEKKIKIIDELNSASEIKKTKTIHDLKEDIKELDTNKKYINFSFLNSISKNGELKQLLKKNISKKEIEFISLEIQKFNSLKKDFRNNFQEKDKNKILNAKKKLYNNIYNFIIDDKKLIFNKFVEKDLLRIEKTFNISGTIEIKKKILNKKVNNIKGKIIENNLILEKKRNKILEKTIKAKIILFKNSKKFKKIGDKRVKKIFNIVILKINRNIKKLKHNKIKNFKKINYLNTVKKILSNFF